MEERDDTGIKVVFCRGSSNYMCFLQGIRGGDANAFTHLLSLCYGVWLILWRDLNDAISFSARRRRQKSLPCQRGRGQVLVSQ